MKRAAALLGIALPDLDPAVGTCSRGRPGCVDRRCHRPDRWPRHVRGPPVQYGALRRPELRRGGLLVPAHGPILVGRAVHRRDHVEHRGLPTFSTGPAAPRSIPASPCPSIPSPTRASRDRTREFTFSSINVAPGDTFGLGFVSYAGPGRGTRPATPAISLVSDGTSLSDAAGAHHHVPGGRLQGNHPRRRCASVPEPDVPAARFPIGLAPTLAAVGRRSRDYRWRKLNRSRNCSGFNSL